MRPIFRGHALVTGALIGALAFAPVVARADEPPAEPAPHFTGSQHFTVDPVVDGVVIAGGAAFSILLNQILSTGEIRPTPVVQGQTMHLLSIDRAAVTQNIDPNAGTYSDYGLYAAVGYAVLDPVLSGVRDGARTGLIDGMMYAESVAITSAFTDATKIAVRRPRPVDYANCGGANPNPDLCSATDLQLSFFSGHASTTGAIVGTATYLAFIRSGWHSPRPWITLGVGTLLTAFVSYERVRSGEHFPTDVIMGSLAGAGIGVLVPHLHRRPHYHEKEYEAPPIWIGYQPRVEGGGSLNLALRF
jgi:membrane-associated phospholipid phosphatase